MRPLMIKTSRGVWIEASIAELHQLFLDMSVRGPAAGERRGHSGERWVAGPLSPLCVQRRGVAGAAHTDPAPAHPGTWRQVLVEAQGELLDQARVHTAPPPLLLLPPPLKLTTR